MLLTNCYASENKLTSDLDRKALAKLYETFHNRENSKDVEIKNDEIRVGKTKIKVTTAIEFDGNHQNSWIFAARYETKLVDDKETVFTISSIGIGKDKKDAEETSIDEWIALFGTSLSEMVLKPDKGILIENYQIFPGLMGIRGEAPSQSWIDGSESMSKKIVNSLLPIIKKSDKKLTSINLLIKVSENGSVEGECRINNETSKDLLEAIQKLDWKTGQQGYLFKQFYLIKNKS
ncbi:MAG: DUF6348 family protein [Acidobacteriota bacterium]|nr:DUF6348 family protein [Acidobacteriota bacterium]